MPAISSKPFYFKQSGNRTYSFVDRRGEATLQCKVYRDGEAICKVHLPGESPVVVYHQYGNEQATELRAMRDWLTAIYKDNT